MKIKGQPGFLRDNSSGAIINNDKDGYLAYKKQRKRVKEKDAEIINLKSKVENLENLINELIKQIKD
jgi:hypothetical protein